MIYSRSPGWQSPQEQKNVSPAPYPWRKLYSCKNKTFLGPTFPFPWSSGLSSLAALGRQLSCRSRKVKSCPSESLVLTWIHSFRGKVRGIYIPRHFKAQEKFFRDTSSLRKNFSTTLGEKIWNSAYHLGKIAGLRPAIFSGTPGNLD